MVDTDTFLKIEWHGMNRGRAYDDPASAWLTLPHEPTPKIINIAEAKFVFNQFVWCHRPTNTTKKLKNGWIAFTFGISFIEYSALPYGLN